MATPITRKNIQGRLVRATAVPASFVHNIMSESRSKRQVVILDCCFSGAFAEGLSAKDDGFVDVKNQLGGEGRAVLTASTSTQYAFEQQGADLSTYSRYIVEGIETGAADRDNDGWISVDELHEYAQRKVQEAAPTMNPQIFAIKEGYKIQLAKAPIDDSKIKYRREVEYWAIAGSGQISNIGGVVLDDLRDQMGLTVEDTKAIESEVLKPYREYERKLERYEETFVKEIQRQYPISDDTRNQLIRLQQSLSLRPEDTALIESRITAERQGKLQQYEEAFRRAIEQEFPLRENTHEQLKHLQQDLELGDEDKALIENCIIAAKQTTLQGKSRKYIKSLFFGCLGCLIGVGSTWIFTHIKNTPATTQQSSLDKQITPVTTQQSSLDKQISLGEEILVKADTNSDKESGVQAFNKGDFQSAINKFQSSLKNNPNDPEALIYKNNAEAAKQESNLQIAVSVPIGTNPNVAKEILRGVAQAQDEVNKKGGIDKKLLQVAIANDNNDPELVKKVATAFVNNSSILAVVGHNSSESSLAAKPIYDEGNLVMISPTSDADALSNDSPVFHVTPIIDNSVRKLIDYAKQKRLTKLVICYDSQSAASKNFKKKFTEDFSPTNIVQINCDLSENKFDSQKIQSILSQAFINKTNGILLVPGVKNAIDNAIEMGKAAQKKNLTLLGSPTINTYKILEQGQSVEGMVVVVLWNPTTALGKSFADRATQLWGNSVNWRNATLTWRTAMAYDATNTIIAILTIMRYSNNSEQTSYEYFLESP